MNTRKLTHMSLLLSVALIVFVIELRIPPILPIPGVKLGLANTVILFSLFTLKKSETLMILVLRVVIGNIFAGGLLSMLYSISGGLLCFIIMSLISKLTSKKQIWICSVCGAIGHNIGQIIVAIFLTKATSIVFYLPVLMISAVITGALTGLIAQLIIERLEVLQVIK